jgi:DNA-binding GntR family transcriptional regulator
MRGGQRTDRAKARPDDTNTTREKRAGCWLANDDVVAPEVRKSPLPTQIADHLGHLILRGDYQPGERLKEMDVAATYQVSRGPVREAFRLLERRGLVEVVPRHGARICTLDIGEVHQVFSVRAVLFGLAAREAASVADATALARLERVVEILEESARTMSITPIQHAMHAGEAQFVIARATGNALLLRMLDEVNGRALWRMIWNERPLDFETRGRRRESAGFWRRLLRALKAKDGARAEQIARAILEASRDHTLAVMRQREMPAPAAPRRRSAAAAPAPAES